MYFAKFKKMLAGIIAGAMLISTLPAMAAESEIEVILEDVTATETNTLLGEAKIKVSVKGAAGSVSIAQMALAFEGDLKYKSIQFLQGENNPPAGFLYSPNAALANTNKTLLPSIISSKGLDFKEETDLFILTFAGDAGETVTLRVDDLDNTYCTVDGVDIKASKGTSVTATASSKENEGKEAVVRLVMDQVTDFTAGSQSDGAYTGSGVEVKITSEQTDGYTVYTVLNNTLVSKGGHRENESIPTFTLKNTVLAGDTYTVEVSGIGYIPYQKTGVTFDDVLEITNADFIPGDVNADKKIDAADKAECEKAAADEAYAADLGGAADFNRDGVVNQYDLDIFQGIADETETPEKMQTPTVSGGNRKVTVTWTKPEDDSITGYTIQYGTSRSNLSESKDITDKDAVSTELTELAADTTYYVQIAAKNADGTGAYSDIASAKTDASSTGGTGGGTGGGSGGGGGGSTGGGGFTGGGTGTTPGGTTTPTPTPDTTNPAEPFTDLANYDWAKDSIYSLYEKGIISGTGATTYSPADNIKRGDFILILTRMLGVDDAFTENFADVPADSYYYNAIGSAKAAGIASGDGVNYMPENPITRQDLITLAYRAFLGKGYIAEAEDFTSLDVFSDKDSISEYAMAPMASMVKAGIIQGSDGGVNPLGNATRAEVAVMCARLLDLMQ